jgi:GMP synthase-like glutamine amidotransferase
MRIHVLQHVAFEGEANIGVWAREHGFPVTRTRLYASETLPPASAIDLLVVMGGPMNIYEEDRYPWLAAEKRFLREIIISGARALGVCLGAQLLADVLGGPVTRNPLKEIGWFPVTLTQDGAASPLFADFPTTFPAFHWHGDTFALPPGTVHAASSAACTNQAFVYDERIVGLQFHLESTAESISRLADHGGDELVAGPCIQPAGALARADHLADIRRLLYRLLDALAG